MDVFSGKISPDQEIDNAFETGEGMNYAQFVAGIERLETIFTFTQMAGDVPIEHASLNASAWEGQTVTAVWGSLINNYGISNNVALTEVESEEKAFAELATLDGISCLDESEYFYFREKLRIVNPDLPTGQKARCGLVEEGPNLIMLANGSDASGVIQLHHTYRMIIRMEYLLPIGTSMPAAFQLWLDADTGKILKMIALVHNIAASGRVFNRDPGAGTTTLSFAVDPAVGSNYELEFSAMIDRIDFQADGYNAGDLTIPDSGASSTTFANFNQAPINNSANAICDSGGNSDFQQVNVFAELHRYTQQGIGLTVFTPFPRTGEFTVDVEVSGYCNASNGSDVLTFGACNGYFNASCPNLTGSPLTDRRINPAHDNTVIAHEHAHSLTPRFTNTRPSDWCGAVSCEIPTGWSVFHDLADAWPDHFESTNCTAGWYAKNQGGVDNSLNCANSSEGGAFPRAHELEWPFNPGNALDHFPEHRSLASGAYSEMQMPTAALWQVRTGMRSKCKWSGIPQYGVRFARALKRTGFFGASVPGSSDQGIYRYIHDFEEKLMDEWASAGSPGGPPAFVHNGPHTANKVSAGFAKGGTFLIPHVCLDSDAGTTDPSSCSGGTNGGDAVIDIDDNDPADDYSINGMLHEEVDFLELGGAAPSFHVWTGPRYQFNGSGAATFPNPSLCNEEYRVEVSDADTFPGGSTFNSGWVTVDRDPTTAGSAECYDEWTLPNAAWTSLQAGGDGTRIYFRVTTRFLGGGNERVSTEPGAGLWIVPPPYSVITSNGLSDY